MKVSLNWARNVSNANLTKIGKDKLIEKIGAQLGAVEEVIDFGSHYKNIFIVKVVSCDKHPDADKLSVCWIDDSKKARGVKRNNNGHVQVVCGAPNVAAGQVAIWLPPGTTVPATYDKDPLVLESREIRGVISNGMLASASELGISDNHEGIVALDSSYKAGDDFAEAFSLNDTIVDIENKMFTHRPDCFGILGVARELAGITQQKFESPKWYLTEKAASENTKDYHLLEVINEIPQLVPRFMAQVVENIQVKPSDFWLQTYLARVGIRPINNIVDITNYIMYLTGQPMHAYDYDKVKDLSGRAPTLVARDAKKGDRLKLLNGKTYEIEPGTIMIATDKQAIGVGGVMGGADTEVDENTKNIILECANFDMYSIRRTAMKYGHFTEAVTRFTKGQSPWQCDRALAHAINEIVHQSGGTPARTIYDKKAKLKVNSSVKVSTDFINERLGLSLTPVQITKLLENVEFKTRANGKQLVVAAPFWRTDIEIPEDIVEEVGRLYGYDHLPLDLPEHDLTPASKNTLLSFKSRLRNILARAGANEVLTYSFVHGDLLDKVGQDRDQAFQLNNALSPDLQYYRLSLTPSLLEKVHPNIKAGYDEFAIFEIGKTHNKKLRDKNENDLPRELEQISLIFAANDKVVKARHSGAAYYQAVRYLTFLMHELGLEFLIDKYDGKPKNEVDKQFMAPFDLKRIGAIRIGEEVIGVVGEIKPSVRKSLKLPSHMAVVELGLTKLLQVVKTGRNYQPLPRFPKVEQDICLRITADLPYAELEKLVRETIIANTSNSRRTITTLDIYQRENDLNNKQITFGISIASYERTLTDKEISKLLDMVAEEAANKFNAVRV